MAEQQQDRPDRDAPQADHHPAETSAAATPLSRQRLAGLVTGPVVAIAILLLPPPDEMSPEAWRMVAITTWMVIWWLSEAIPIPATALLPIVLMPVLDVQALQPTAANYANPLIFLFLGGFLIAVGMERSGLHRRIALNIVSRVGTSPSRIILGFMMATAFLSMWISNTATAIMMFAVALSVIDFVRERTEDATMVRNFGVALMLSIAYSASIGGAGTLIGTPPNALLASFLETTFDIEVSFFDWMLIGVPVVLIMLPIAWLLLTRLLFPSHRIAIDNPRGVVDRELSNIGPLRPAERLVAVVFLGAAALWILRRPIVNATGLDLDDAWIAIAAALVLFAVPVSRARGEFALDWTAAKDVPWGILLLFGGGLALASAFSSSGLAWWIGDSVAEFDATTLVLVLAVLVATILVTEVTSNTAATATFLPILGAVAIGFDLSPAVLTVPVAMGASMAFMMPVATPPNAIVFSYEDMELSDMVRSGFLLNVAAVCAIFAVFTLLGPWVFGFTF